MHPANFATDSRRAGRRSKVGSTGGLLRSRHGTTAIEFAIAAIPLLVLLIGIIELGWQLTTAAALDAAVLRASRFGITGQATTTGEPAGYTCRSQTIDWMIRSAAGGLFNLGTLNISLQSSSGVGGDSPVSGAGAGGQIVTYTVTYTQPFLTGAWVNLIGGSATLKHQSTVVVKNEPFDNSTC